MICRNAAYGRALLLRERFCIFGGLLSAGEKSHARGREATVPTAGMARVMAGSPSETAMRQGSTPVEVLPVLKALRQVGPPESEAWGAQGQRAFSWLLFS
jgi:hypothetical protein